MVGSGGLMATTSNAEDSAKRYYHKNIGTAGDALTTSCRDPRPAGVSISASFEHGEHAVPPSFWKSAKTA